jgi:hypothetical protein
MMGQFQLPGFPGQEIDSTSEATTESADGTRRVASFGARMAPVARMA